MGNNITHKEDNISLLRAKNCVAHIAVIAMNLRDGNFMLQKFQSACTKSMPATERERERDKQTGGGGAASTAKLPPNQIWSSRVILAPLSQPLHTHTTSRSVSFAAVGALQRAEKNHRLFSVAAFVRSAPFYSLWRRAPANNSRRNMRARVLFLE